MLMLTNMSNSVTDRLRLKLKYPRRVREAAQQMWTEVQRGVSFEIPASLSTDDPTTKAVLCLQEMHPDCPVTMLQSRGIIIGHAKSSPAVSKEAWAILEHGSYFPEADKAKNAENFLAQQERFMRRTLTGIAGGREEYGIEALVAKAQADQQKRDALTVGAVHGGTTLVTADDPAGEALVNAVLKAETPAEPSAKTPAP